MANYKNAATDRLIDVIAAMKSREECYALFEDLCTIKEIKEMSQRLEVAVLLSKGKSYQEVNAETGVSTATISRVSKCLSYGSGGYLEALKIINEKESAK